MKKFILIPIAAAIFMTGCASGGNYKLYTDAQVAVAEARAASEIARYQALADIAKSGDTTTKTVAVVSLQQGAPVQQQQSGVAQPKKASDTALQWASVLFPSLTQIYGINRNTEVAIVNSNNSLQGKQADNNMIVDLVKGRTETIIGNKTDADGTTEDFLLYPN